MNCRAVSLTPCDRNNRLGIVQELPVCQLAADEVVGLAALEPEARVIVGSHPDGVERVGEAHVAPTLPARSQQSRFQAARVRRRLVECLRPLQERVFVAGRPQRRVQPVRDVVAPVAPEPAGDHRAHVGIRVQHLLAQPQHAHVLRRTLPVRRRLHVQEPVVGAPDASHRARAPVDPDDVARVESDLPAVEEAVEGAAGVEVEGRGALLKELALLRDEQLESFDVHLDAVRLHLREVRVHGHVQRQVRCRRVLDIEPGLPGPFPIGLPGGLRAAGTIHELRRLTHSSQRIGRHVDRR